MIFLSFNVYFICPLLLSVFCVAFCLALIRLLNVLFNKLVWYLKATLLTCLGSRKIKRNKEKYKEIKYRP